MWFSFILVWAAYVSLRVPEERAVPLGFKAFLSFCVLQGPGPYKPSFCFLLASWKFSLDGGLEGMGREKKDFSMNLVSLALAPADIKAMWISSLKFSRGFRTSIMEILQKCPYFSLQRLKFQHLFLLPEA
jgi:hypothetical protein